MPNFIHENQFSGVVAGVDEVGRGPLAGPVVTAAVILDRKNIPKGLDDSKKLSNKKREILAKEIKDKALSYAFGISEVYEIDEINILQATKRAMERSVAALSVEPGLVLVDGNQLPEFKCKAKAIIKGDSISLSIAAASIIAKVHRDALMAKLHTQHPYYAWDRNAGYGTKAHMEGMNMHGITKHHRMSFAPVKKLVDVA